MTTIFERVATALATLTGISSAMAPFISTDGSLPDTYVVYQLIDSPPEQHADDAETLRSYRVQVSVYSRSGLASLPDVTTAMTNAGFRRGPMHQLPKDPESGHFGLALEFVYLE